MHDWFPDNGVESCQRLAHAREELLMATANEKSGIPAFLAVNATLR
jgi:hypothetical protein